MQISDDKRWKVLIDKKMSKTELKDLAGISFNIIAKLGKCEAVSMESMYKICTALDCNQKRRIGHRGDFMESKAQVRKVASGELDAVQVEFDTEIAEWPILVCGKCVDRLWRKQDERARFYVVDGIVAAHEKRTFLQEKASIGECRMSLYSKRFFNGKVPLQVKNIQYFSGNISFGKIETFYFCTVALYHIQMKIDTMAKAFERKLMLNLVTQFPKIRGDMKT